MTGRRFATGALALSLLLVACGGTKASVDPADAGTTPAADAGTSADAGTTPDAGPATPAVPALGAIIDRAGRPLVNLAITNPFDVTTPTGGRTNTQDAYNAKADPSTWVAAFSPGVQASLGLWDGLDARCGNQFLACGQPGCGPATPAPGRYKTLGDLLADDRLYLDTRATKCAQYLAVELNAAGLGVNDCGGHVPSMNAVDLTYSLLMVGASGVASGSYPVTNGIPPDSTADLTRFPFLASPNP